MGLSSCLSFCIRLFAPWKQGLSYFSVYELESSRQTLGWRWSMRSYPSKRTAFATRHSKRKHSCWWIRESVIVCLCVCIHMHFTAVIFEISTAFIHGCEKYFSLEPQKCILMLLISFHQQCRIILKRAKIELRKWLKYSCRNPKGTVKIQVKALEVKKEKRIF